MSADLTQLPEFYKPALLLGIKIAHPAVPNDYSPFIPAGGYMGSRLSSRSRRSRRRKLLET